MKFNESIKSNTVLVNLVQLVLSSTADSISLSAYARNLRHLLHVYPLNCIIVLVTVST